MMTKPEGGRSGPDQGQTVTGTVVAQLKRLRRRREVTAAALAQRCAALGAPEITEHVIRNIEVGRRTVSVDQLAVLALALDVAPAHLLCPARPREGHGEPAPIRVTETVVAEPDEYAQWVRGDAPLPEGDEQAFYAYALENTPSAKDRQAMVAYARHRVRDRSARLVQELQADADARVAQARGDTLRVIGDLQAAINEGGGTARLLAVLTAARDATGATAPA
jgi:transcriptional regulator with XRE-family HTH domain